jgi:hypothetical protein
VGIDPKLPQAWYYLGLSLGQSSKAGDWEEAETSLLKSVALTDGFHSAWLELGHVQLRRGRDAHAVTSLERARALLGPAASASDAPRQTLQDLIRTDHLLGKAYRRLGQRAKEAEMRRECDALNERMQRLSPA